MRWPGVFRGAREAAEREVRAELEAHFSGSVDLLVSRGWSEEAARAEVHRRFGNESKYRRELVRLARRRMLRDRALRLMAWVPDVFALAWRDVRRQPGASIEARDLREGARSVVVVSERAAARLWPSVDPLGRCLRIGEEPGCATVIGVATDHAGVTWARGALSDPGTMQAWVPAGHPEATPPAALMVRTAVPPARALDAVRRTVAGVPGVRYVEAATMEEFVDRELRSWRTGAAVFSTFGAIALAVAAAGIYGVLAFEVAQRRREFGVRRALGAGRLHVMLPVVATTLPTVAAGLVVGAIAALALAGHVTDLLFQTSPRDAQVHGWAAGVLVLTAVAAVAIPAWRAASVDPREALSEV